MSKPRDDRQKDLLLRRWIRSSTWASAGAVGSADRLEDPERAIQFGVPSRIGIAGLAAGLFILKHMHNLSNEVLCARWIENPSYQYFCGELSFCHRLPFDRSSTTRWPRLGEEQLIALI